jgi:luciferase family oxidoreductase group 1
VKAVPGAGLHVPVWILGSSLYGAQLAAAMGLPYAFASHFAPQQMMQAVDIYRATFRPSAYLAKPYVMLGFNVFAADTDDQAHLLASSAQQAFVNLRSGRPAKIPPPVENFMQQLGEGERALLNQILACSAIGSPATVTQQMRDFISRTGADELMIASNIFEHQARLHSYEIVATISSALS